MRGANADVVIVEIIGFEWPLLEILNGVISDERLIALPILEVIDPFVILGKHIT